MASPSVSKAVMTGAVLLCGTDVMVTPVTVPKVKLPSFGTVALGY